MVTKNTGSLISIKENVENIVIPSEEEKIRMYPMDFEEFIWAEGAENLWNHIIDCYQKRIAPDRAVHEMAMRILREYMLVGGMPQAVNAFFSNHRDFNAADIEKRNILNLYLDDIRKTAKKYSSKVSAVFEHIPAALSKHEKRIVLSEIDDNGRFSKYDEPLFWLEDSMICNLCYLCNDPSVGFALNIDESRVKAYLCDTGLLVSLAFSENELSDNTLYNAIMNDKHSLNEGMIYENVIAQMITAKGRKLYYYTHYSTEKKRNDIEIDFLLSNESKLNFKIFPVEVKSSKNYTTTSLDAFKNRFNIRIAKYIIIHPKNCSFSDEMDKYPPYMIPLMFS